MKTNFISRKPWAAHLAFLALFPGFFFYHAALGLGTIDALLAGYFSPVCLAFMPFLLAFYVHEIKLSRRFFTMVDFIFFGFLLYFFLVIVMNFANGANEVIVKQYAADIVQFAAVFIIFKVADFSSKPFRWALFVCLAAMATIIFHFSVDGFFDLKDEHFASAAETVSTYQGFARSYFLTVIVLLAFTRPIALRILIYVVSVPALFINGARSELIALIAIIPIVEALYAKNRVLALAMVLMASTMAMILMFYSEPLIGSLPDNRVLELLNLSQSSSWEDRRRFFAYALDTIEAHPLLGDFGSYISLGGTGSYAHNVFSAWVDLGLVGFVYVLAMTILPACNLVFDLISPVQKDRKEGLILAFVLLSATLLLIFTSKAFTEMVIAAALGQYANYRFCYGRSS